jgi:molybdate/tungstate transport system ATP-binding protein
MINLLNICWGAGDFNLANVTFEVPAGKYGVMMGSTGSGKTSIIEIICGLRRQHSGEIVIGNQTVSDAPPGKRGIGYVPQDGALFPTMTVREQIGFALRIRSRNASEIQRTVDELAEQLGVSHLLDRKPPGLSGGERQRVALGRALAAKPKVLLLDEPLSALDEDMRDDVASLLKRVQQEHGLTALHITHSREEAGRLADVLFHLKAGKITEAER